LPDLEDIFVEIFVGRHPQDLLELGAKYSQLYQRNLSSVSSTVRSKDLAAALDIISEQNRPDTNVPVDNALVQKDVTRIVSLLRATFPRAEELFEILLRRSNSHIQQVSITFETHAHEPLDKAIRKNTGLGEMARNIGVHAVRTATHITYRDAMLLRDAMSGVLGNKNKQKLAIRVTRMHFYKQHWMQIKAEYTGVFGKDFRSKMGNLSDGVFRNLMYTMASV